MLAHRNDGAGVAAGAAGEHVGRQPEKQEIGIGAPVGLARAADNTRKHEVLRHGAKKLHRCAAAAAPALRLLDPEGKASDLHILEVQRLDRAGMRLALGGEDQPRIADKGLTLRELLLLAWS